MGTQTRTTPPSRDAADRRGTVRCRWIRASRLLLALIVLAMLAGSSALPALAATLGGRGFAVSTSILYEGAWVDNFWTGGDLQGGYWGVLYTDGHGGYAAGWNAADATSATGPHEPRFSWFSGFYCQILAPAASDQFTILGNSDMLCFEIPDVRGAAPTPQMFTIRLNESTRASLAWDNVPGTDSLLLVAFPLDGSPTRYQALSAATTSATDETGGVNTCYILVAGTPAGVVNTGALCGVPGYASFPDTTAARSAARTAPNRAIAQQRDEVQAGRFQSQVKQLKPKMQDALREAKKRLTRVPRT